MLICLVWRHVQAGNLWCMIALRHVSTSCALGACHRSYPNSNAVLMSACCRLMLFSAPLSFGTGQLCSFSFGLETFAAVELSEGVHSCAHPQILYFAFFLVRF